MRQKGETASLADRLNNALAQLHAQKIAFDQQRTEILGQLDRAKEETERLRVRNRQLRRGREDQGVRSDGEGEQIVLKMQHYLSRVQESCKQMVQVASECRVFDVEIQRAAALIQRNILKTVSGLQKYSQELVRQWCQRETLRLENSRLEAENKQLFELTTRLQHNFKETDRLLKQLSQPNKEDKYSAQLRGRIYRLEDQRESQGSAELEEKILRLGEKVRLLEQENTTIKNIHQRTMKKLEKLEERNRQQEEEGPSGGGGGEGLEEQRRRWLQKHQELHEEVRRLTKELLLAEESENKAKEELDGCVEIYAQWEVERKERKAELDKLRVAIETYLQKIEELQLALGEARGQAQAMGQRLEVSEAEKEKIVSVYQLEVQELNDLLFKKQDALSEMDAIVSREHLRLEELKKQHAELTKFTQNLQDNCKKAVTEAADVRQLLIDQEQVEIELKETITKSQEAIKQLRIVFGKEREELQTIAEREQREKQEMAEIMGEYKEEYYCVKKEMSALQEDIQNLHDQQFSIKQELRSILAFSDDSLDVWTLLAKIRDHLMAVSTENKNLKEAQRQLLIQSQRKQHESTTQLQELQQKYEAQRESREDQKRNQEFSLMMCKMKAVERQICSENVLLRVKTFKDLAEMVIGVVKKENRPQEAEQNEGEIEELKQQLLTLQKQHNNLVENHKQAALKIIKAQEEISLLRQMVKDSQNLRKQIEQELNTSMRDLTVERQLSQRLIEQCESLKIQRETTNGEMAALAGQLSKIQTQMDDYQDQKTSIQSKLENARKIHRRNDELEEKISELQAEISSLNGKIEGLEERLQVKVKQVIENDNSFNLLNAQEEPARQDKQQISEQQYLSQINALLQENSQLQSELSSKLIHIDELEYSLSLMDQNQRLQAEKRLHLQKQLEESGKQLQEYKRICLRWEQEGALLTAVRQQLQRNEQESKQQLMQNASEYIDLTLENQASKHEIQELEERLQRLEGELQLKNAKISSLSAQLQRIKEQKEHYEDGNTQKAQLQMQVIARQEEVRISLANIHQRETEWQTRLNQTSQRIEELGLKQMELKQRQDELLRKEQRLGHREQQCELQELSLLKREQQMRERQQHASEQSLLGMQSLRQSQAHRGDDQAVKQQLREEVYILKQAILDRDVTLMAKEAVIKDCMQNQSENHTKIQQYQKEMAQLQEQLGEYREHSDHLKQSLIELKQQSHGQYEELRRQKQHLQQKFLQDKQLLYESSLKNEELIQKLERITLEHNDQIQQLQHELQHKQMRIQEYENTVQQHQSTIKHFTSLLAQKQDLLHQKSQQLQEKQKINNQLITQTNSIKAQNEDLQKQLALKESRCAQVQAQVKVARQQNFQYAQRLSQIEEIMDAVRREQNESQILRERLQDTLEEKKRLEQAVTGMENSFAFSSNNIAIFEKRNKELSQELSSSRQQIEALRLNSDKISKQLQKTKENALMTKESLLKYEKIGSITEINVKIQDYPNLLKSCEEYQQKCLQLQKAITQLKAKIQQSQRQLFKKDEQLSIKEAVRIKLQEQCRQLREVSRRNGTLDEQNEHLSSKNLQLKQDFEECREELLERQAKLSEFKENHFKELAQRELLQSQLRDREAECKALQQQAEHYRQEVKRLGKEKAQAKSQAIKSKFSLEEQQSVLKVKEGTLMRESTERDEVIRQLKQEVDSLREQNSVLMEQGQLESISRTSRRSSTVGHPGYQTDIPLQIPPRSKQKSAHIQQKPQENEEYRHPKGEDRLSNRLRESEMSNASLSSEVQSLRGQLRGKQANMDSLQRQFKGKAEDYSKLQRIVESLRDELNLQRKRVRNFEDLYQSIQEKRIKMAIPKQE